MRVYDSLQQTKIRPRVHLSFVEIDAVHRLDTTAFPAVTMFPELFFHIWVYITNKVDFSQLVSTVTVLVL